MQIGRAWQRAESCHTHSHHTHSRRTLVDLHPSLAQVPDEPKRTMSFFEKLKNLHSGPPAPPKRIDTNTAYGWSEDEFGEEEGDTYEAPPCERPTIKVQRQPVEENVYLGYPERPHPVIPQRQAAPPPRPAKITPKMRPPEPPTDQEEFYIDPNNRKFPEVNRKDKKGPLRKSPPAIPAPNLEEDVYLDPNEGQSGREPPHDVYLEPTPARPPIPRGGVRMVLPPKTIGRDPPPPIIKPPVPRAKSNSLISSDSVKPVPPPEMRSLTFPTKAPPPTPNNKPPLPIGLKEPKPSPPPPPSVDSTVPVMPPGGQEAGLQNREWFAGICGRKTAEDALLKVKKDGSFLVRCSTAQNAQQPYTLVVLFNQKVYNIPVRFLKDSSSYALGKEGKKNEELFSSLQEMISHHKDNPLLLIDSKSQAKNTTYLTHPVHP
ncbi:SH2 domain-containing protein 6 isoform X1 [Colossoma macropomum]|uniref:SH2 domain-containing protein 6 isoform X1 n=1 Tax=Colossoma macropomum TaxID=42526 RepID=UPI001864E838|nr:SH2 domain-containing protein 6 isoform X1 [Colossoma macropomum]